MDGRHPLGGKEQAMPAQTELIRTADPVDRDVAATQAVKRHGAMPFSEATPHFPARRLFSTHYLARELEAINLAIVKRRFRTRATAE
jgi:hypothetical protein